MARLVTIVFNAYRQESSLYAAEHRIKHDTNWEQEASCRRRNAGQRRNDGRATSQEHGRDEDVSHEAKDNVDAMGFRSVTCSNRLEEGVC